MSDVISEIKRKPINKYIDSRELNLKRKKNEEWLVFKTGTYQTSAEEEEVFSNKVHLKLIRKRQKNYFQRVNKLLSVAHIHNFLDQLCINEQTMKNSQNDESVLKTMFQLRTISKVEVEPGHITLFLKSNSTYTSIPYIVERFNSFGDHFFHSIAQQLSNFYQFFSNPQVFSVLNSPLQSEQALRDREKETQKIINSLAGKPFFMKCLPNNFIISKQLLDLMGRDMIQFAQQCSQYRVIVEDIFTTDNYRFLLQKSFAFFQCFCKVIKGEYTLQSLIQSSTLNYIDTIRGRNQKRIKVKVKGYMPNYFCVVMLIEQILGEEKNVVAIAAKDEQQMKKYLQEFITSNSNTIKHLTPLQSQYLAKQSDKVCSYKIKPNKKKKNIEQEYLAF